MEQIEKNEIKKQVALASRSGYNMLQVIPFGSGFLLQADIKERYDRKMLADTKIMLSMELTVDEKLGMMKGKK